MIKKTLMMMIAVCCFAISLQAEPLPEKTQKEILTIISKSRVKISFEVYDMKISDKNEIILRVKGDKNFVDNAAITIPQNGELKDSIEKVLAFIKINSLKAPVKRLEKLIYMKDSGFAFRHEEN